MRTTCVELPSHFGEKLLVYYTSDFIIIGNEEKIRNSNLIIINENDFKLKQRQVFNAEIENLRNENALLKNKVKELQRKDYKNRALKASLTRTNKIINKLIS